MFFQLKVLSLSEKKPGSKPGNKSASLKILCIFQLKLMIFYLVSTFLSESIIILPTNPSDTLFMLTLSSLSVSSYIHRQTNKVVLGLNKLPNCHVTLR